MVYSVACHEPQWLLSKFISQVHSKQSIWSRTSYKHNKADNAESIYGKSMNKLLVKEFAKLKIK